MIRLNIIQHLVFTIPNLLFILGLISLLNIILITGSPFKNYILFIENNNHFLLKITPIYGKENVGSFGDDYIFPPFREDGSNVEDKDRDDGVSGNSIEYEDEDDDDSNGGGSSGSSNSNSNGGGSLEDNDNTEGGDEERINENTNDFNPLSSSSTNTDDKANPDNKVNPMIGQQSGQVIEDASKVGQQTNQPLNQTVGNEVNQTLEQQQQQQDIGQQPGLQKFGVDEV
ncbi:MAG TPA: hypothetical protein VJ697_11685 [Nitrososphaeraceae archaeon]|nr:hypothetical protein [Nitrososphaeraceae archaeon]